MYYDLTMTQVDLIQTDYYPTERCPINPMAFLFNYIKRMYSCFLAINGVLLLDMCPINIENMKDFMQTKNLKINFIDTCSYLVNV